MGKSVPVYNMDRLVTDTDADFLRRQKLSSMFGMFQDIAALHAANLGGEVNWLRDVRNVAWILMRIRVEVDRYPALAQNVIVETWPQAQQGLYERDYTISGTDGEVLVRSAALWIIMNLGTREITREKFCNYQGLDIKKERALGRGVGRRKPMEGAEPSYEKEIKFSDIDYNGHVNNAKYVDFVMDMFSMEEHKAREIKAIEMHYTTEISPGDVLVLRRKALDEGADYIDGVRKEDGSTVFNGLLEWRGVTDVTET